MHCVYIYIYIYIYDVIGRNTSVSKQLQSTSIAVAIGVCCLSEAMILTNKNAYTVKYKTTKYYNYCQIAINNMTWVIFFCVVEY